MAQDIRMPQMGEGVTEGTLNLWHRQVGDEITRDEPFFEVSTDKVDAEIPAPVSGVLLEVLAQPGQTVPVGAVVARVGTREELERDPAPAPAPAPEPETAAEPAPPPAPRPAPPPEAPPEAPAPAAAQAPVSTPTPPAAPVGAPAVAAPAAVTPPPAPAAPAPGSLAEARRVRSSPLVRAIAREHGISDLSAIPGSGLDGRVTKPDILAHIERGEHRLPAGAGGPAAPASAPAAGAGGWPDGVDLTPWMPVVGEGDVVEPMNNVRRRTVEHMLASRRISAHVSTIAECDMSRCARLRKARGAAFEEQTGARLTFTVFFLRAVVDALRRHPLLNASVSADRQSIIKHPDVNMGLAVALDWGLIVPVIKQAQHLSTGGLAAAVQDLAYRARHKQLKPEEVEGGTFTFTNPGMIGSLIGTPIIPQPQVAIIGVGAIKKRPVVVEESGEDVIAIRHHCFLTLSFDHRLVDGAVADQFLMDVVRCLEQFEEGWL